MRDNANLPMKHYIMPFYGNGVKELYLLIDNPEENSLNHFGRIKRNMVNPVSESHSCAELTDNLLVPQNNAKMSLAQRHP